MSNPEENKQSYQLSKAIDAYESHLSQLEKHIELVGGSAQLDSPELLSLVFTLLRARDYLETLIKDKRLINVDLFKRIIVADQKIEELGNRTYDLLNPIQDKGKEEISEIIKHISFPNEKSTWWWQVFCWRPIEDCITADSEVSEHEKNKRTWHNLINWKLFWDIASLAGCVLLGIFLVYNLSFFQNIGFDLTKLLSVSGTGALLFAIVTFLTSKGREIFRSLLASHVAESRIPFYRTVIIFLFVLFLWRGLPFGTGVFYETKMISAKHQLKEKEFINAQRTFSEALLLKPNNHKALAGIAQSLEGRGELSEARQYYEQAIDQTDSNDGYEIALTRLELLDGYFQENDEKESNGNRKRVPPENWMGITENDGIVKFTNANLRSSLSGKIGVFVRDYAQGGSYEKLLNAISANTDSQSKRDYVELLSLLQAAIDRYVLGGLYHLSLVDFNWSDNIVFNPASGETINLSRNHTTDLPSAIELPKIQRTDVENIRHAESDFYKASHLEILLNQVQECPRTRNRYPKEIIDTIRSGDGLFGGINQVECLQSKATATKLFREPQRDQLTYNKRLSIFRPIVKYVHKGQSYYYNQDVILRNRARCFHNWTVISSGCDD